MDTETIRKLIRTGRYTVCSHVVDHMFAEGFDEDDCIEVLLHGRMLEDYSDDFRCLVYGRCESSIPLHIVCDYSDKECVELVTAYVPRKPWWVTPTRRGENK